MSLLPPEPLLPQETTYDRVRQFHEAFRQGHRNRERAMTPSEFLHATEEEQKDFDLQRELIREEYEELMDALDDGDLVWVMDALADLDYVMNGLCTLLGLPLEPFAREVHRSNMTKLLPDGSPKLREDGKILKGPNFELPDIQGVMERIRNG